WGQKIGGAIAGGVITFTVNGTQEVAGATGYVSPAVPTEIRRARMAILGIGGETGSKWKTARATPTRSSSGLGCTPAWSRVSILRGQGVETAPPVQRSFPGRVGSVWISSQRKHDADGADHADAEMTRRLFVRGLDELGGLDVAFARSSFESVSDRDGSFAGA